MWSKSWRKSFFWRWKSLIYPWEQLDWTLMILVVGLSLLGVVIIQTTGGSQSPTYWPQHLLLTIIGTILALVMSRCRYEILLSWYWSIYTLINLSLLAVMIMGVAAKGAQRWIVIGGFNFQPSEFAKIGVIITLAALLHQRPADNLPTLFRALAIAVVPWALVFFQPNLGTSLIFGAITLGMLYWSNAHPGWLILMIAPIVSAVLYNLYLPACVLWVLIMGWVAWISLPWPFIGSILAIAFNLLAGKLGNILWGILKDYQKERLIMFLHPEKDPLGGGYHLIQSRIAIGSGGLWGKGLHEGTQTRLNFVPEQHNDFIFSAIGEQLGFVGSVCVLIVFWLICLRLIIIACSAKDNFGSLLCIGVLCMVAFQAVVNISMNVGLGPVTGIPLPWLSYGGSSLLANFMALGIVESVANYRPKKRKF